MTDPVTADLQALLDHSIASSSEHLRSIIVPGQRTLSARQVIAALTGVCHLALATVTARCEPRVSAVDGHFRAGRFVFGTSATARKARHFLARPAVSAAHLRGDDLGVFVHGTATVIPAGSDEFAALDRYWEDVYGVAATTMGDEIVFARIDPTWMVAFAPEPERYGPA